MKKLFAAIAVIVLVGMAAAPAAALNVTFMDISPWGQPTISHMAQIPDMSKADLWAAMGTPWRQWGFCDAWLGGDQIYLVYYNVSQMPISVVILPVTGW